MDMANTHIVSLRAGPQHERNSFLWKPVGSDEKIITCVVSLRAPHGAVLSSFWRGVAISTPDWYKCLLLQVTFTSCREIATALPCKSRIVPFGPRNDTKYCLVFACKSTMLIPFIRKKLGKYEKNTIFFFCFLGTPFSMVRDSFGWGDLYPIGRGNL